MKNTETTTTKQQEVNSNMSSNELEQGKVMTDFGMIIDEDMVGFHNHLVRIKNENVRKWMVENTKGWENHPKDIWDKYKGDEEGRMFLNWIEVCVGDKVSFYNCIRCGMDLDFFIQLSKMNYWVMEEDVE